MGIDGYGYVLEWFQLRACVPGAGIKGQVITFQRTSNYVPHYLYLSLYLMTAATQVLNYRPTTLWNCGATTCAVVAFVIINGDTHLYCIPILCKSHAIRGKHLNKSVVFFFQSTYWDRKKWPLFLIMCFQICSKSSCTFIEISIKFFSKSSIDIKSALVRVKS